MPTWQGPAVAPIPAAPVVAAPVATGVAAPATAAVPLVEAIPPTTWQPSGPTPDAWAAEIAALLHLAKHVASDDSASRESRGLALLYGFGLLQVLIEVTDGVTQEQVLSEFVSELVRYELGRDEEGEAVG